MGDRISVEPFRTPRGHPVSMAIRPDTNDWNTLASCLNEDEYQLRDKHLTGWALDIGAYTGGVTVALAVDNPELQVLAVEPVPFNVELLRRNLELNGVADRVTIFSGAVGPPGVTFSEIRFGYRGDANLEHHAWVGNSSLAYDSGGEVEHDALQVETLGIARLLDRFGIEPTWTKVDCEGAEWAFFEAPAKHLRRLSYIIGEVHPVRGHTALDIFAFLDETHEVTLNGENQDPGPCGFTATLR